MNEFRRDIVNRAFDRLDINKNGTIESSDVKGIYNPSKHPAVMEGRKTEEQVLQEFLETFETHHNIKHGQAKDYVVTRDEFTEYYENISASIDSDEYFETMMNNAWNLSGKADTYTKFKKGTITVGGKGEPTQKRNAISSDSPFKTSNPIPEDSKSVHSKASEDLREHLTKMREEGKVAASSPSASEKREDRNAEEERKVSNMKGKTKFGNIVATDMPKYQNIMLERFRTKLAARGGKGVIGLERQFKIFDLDGSGALDREEFKKAINDYKLEMDERDLDNLFKIFDKDADNKIDYQEFMETILGKMNEFRLNLVMKAFDTLDENGSGTIDFDEITKVYNAKLHPEVKAGRKTEEEVLTEFTSTFEIHHKTSTDKVDNKITKEEFIQYYTKLSAAIENDAFFDLMITNAWRLGIKGNVDKQPYAGITKKVYQVDSKSCWNYDHHKTMFQQEHPLMHGDDENKSVAPSDKNISIYERSKAALAATAKGHAEEVIDRKEYDTFINDIECLTLKY